MTERCRGQVIQYDPARGHGRIEDSQGRLFFVHYRDLAEGTELAAGDAVEFLPLLNRKGHIAQEVRACKR